MFNLNELAVIAYENAAKREAKDGKVSTDTMKMLKHTATEVVEAVESYVAYRDIKNLAEDLTATDLDEKWESLEEPDVAEEHYQKNKRTVHVRTCRHCLLCSHYCRKRKS